jgi:hypothetical protein
MTAFLPRLLLTAPVLPGLEPQSVAGAIADGFKDLWCISGQQGVPNCVKLANLYEGCSELPKEDHLTCYCAQQVVNAIVGSVFLDLVSVCRGGMQ